MGSGTDNTVSRGPQDAAPDASSNSPGAKRGKGDSKDVGRALRTVYDSALGESVPKEMLDLLGKLD
ncbi:NepR family anti-sigma factor [Sphingomonas sanxanigenens]|uniref:Anti-sigma factor NepR domain-containing protein n=1 Tax=Sphingomonas sanxanigenens DSM 19645 = NX02 TaxID=1123269 RepID=W0A5N5_9SPHN|nr:NepR family anti-sigma factor [Sphingomonas sanxanigenens]AHE51792.1 hypothetical protein NX02_00115 [Sphingomonas sanxanigenens DSM 19645 = NX02]